MKKKISLSKSLPLTIGMVLGITVASYMFSSLNATFNIGRPSSTAVVGYIFIPIYALIVGLTGTGIGLIIKIFLQNRTEEQDQVSRTKYFIVTIIILALLILYASFSSVQEIKNFEKLNTPQQISNLGNFEKVSIPKDTIPNIQVKTKIVWNYEKKYITPVTWNNKRGYTSTTPIN